MWMKSLRQKYYRKIFRAMSIPERLSDITNIDSANERKPEDVGISSEIVQKIWSATEALFRTGVHPMLSICVRHRGEIILNRSLGYVRGIWVDEGDVEPQVANTNTPICLLSASKFVSAMLVHLLAEQGEINILDPLSYYIPEFAAKGKGAISIHQLLSHRAGVPNLPKEVTADLLKDHSLALKLICDAEASNRDGRDMAYHAITGGYLVDELIRVTTGLNAQQYLDLHIRRPLGMTNFRYGVEKNEREFVARNYITGLPSEKIIGGMLKNALGLGLEDVVAFTNDERFMDAVLPAANLYATAEETSRFLQMMLNHGEWQGQQVLDPLTIYRATREADKTRLDKTIMLPMRYSAGAMLGGKPVGLYGRDSHHAFGHVGLSNVFCWADPERALSVAILNSGKPIVGPHLKALLYLIDLITSSFEPVVDMASDKPIYQKEGIEI
jgi:CubicO group peptidase (beta-lactamase class C family)